MIGSLIGSVLGYKFGGFFGLIIGGILGAHAETWISENLLGKPSRKAQVQSAYFEALFVTMGKLAKADGVITKNEIRKCEAIMNHMQLDTTRRKEAIKLFNLGKQDNLELDLYLNKFIKASHGAYSMKQVFLEMLIEVASAENKINQAEMNFMYTIADKIRFPRQIFVTLLRMRGFNVNGQNNQQRQRRQSNYQSSGNQQQWQRATLSDPYQTLGVDKADNKAVIRKAYKKLMSANHPDKLIAKGLPPDMIEVAKKKTQTIQAAWEEVKDLRGF
jgi:DnaJ like chaperone protein